MDLSLTAEHRAVRDSVRQWVAEVVTPRALANDRAERFPQEALDGLRALGLMGLTIDEAFGGGGADPLSYVLVIEEIARGDANVRSILSVHLALVSGSVARWGAKNSRPNGCPGWPPARCWVALP